MLCGGEGALRARELMRRAAAAAQQQQRGPELRRAWGALLASLRLEDTTLGCTDTCTLDTECS